MRPQQQGRRQRNRGGSSNRNRNQNPLSRSYESNGPDVKIRGNPQTIADKYAQLARDAISAGDNVMAENYYQHAEHYQRIILAAQPPQQSQEDADNKQSNHNGQDANGNQVNDGPNAQSADKSDQQPVNGEAKDGDSQGAASNEQTNGSSSEAVAESGEAPKSKSRSRKPRSSKSSKASDVETTEPVLAVEEPAKQTGEAAE